MRRDVFWAAVALFLSLVGFSGSTSMPSSAPGGPSAPGYGWIAFASLLLLFSLVALRRISSAWVYTIAAAGIAIIFLVRMVGLYFFMRWG